MDKSIIVTRLNMAVHNKHITNKDRQILLKKLKNLESVIEHRGLDPATDNFDEQFADVCKSVLLMSKYTFQQAVRDYNAESPEEFFDNVWNSLVTITNDFSVSVCDLYTLCNDEHYLNAETSVSAYDFAIGKFNPEDLELLKQIARKQGMCQAPFRVEKEQVSADLKQYEVTLDDNVEDVFDNECGASRTNAILDTIISVDELRSSFIGLNPVDAEAEELLSKVYKTLNVSVFKGVPTCSVKTKKYEEVQRERITEIFAEKGFDVTWEPDDSGFVLVIIAKQYSGDYSAEYTEEDLQSMLVSGLGSVYSFVAVYSRNVLVPKILAGITAEIVKALKKVTIEEKGLEFQKIKTKTSVYEILFASLRAKGFHVIERKGYFEMRWE